MSARKPNALNVLLSSNTRTDDSQQGLRVVLIVLSSVRRLPDLLLPPRAPRQMTVPVVPGGHLRDGLQYAPIYLTLVNQRRRERRAVAVQRWTGRTVGDSGGGCAQHQEWSR